MIFFQLIFSPCQVLMHMSIYFGEKVVSKFTDSWHFRTEVTNEAQKLVSMFGIGILYLVPVMIMTVVVWPIVFFHKLKVLIVLIVRNFICC